MKPYRIPFITIFLFIFLLSGCIETTESLDTIPTPTSIPGWVEYNINDISLQLPAGFESLPLENQIDDEAGTILFVAARENNDDITRSQLLIGQDVAVPLDQTIEFQWFMMDALPESHTWIRNEQLPLNTFPHGLMLSRSYEKGDGFNTYHTHFIFLDNKTYVFVFTTTADKYILDNPEVDQIMNSVRIGENGYGIDQRSNGLCFLSLGVFAIIFLLNLWIRRKTGKTIVFP